MKEFIALLNQKNVKYLVVGGYAVAFHGYPRYTGNIDVFVKISTENASKLAQVLREFGFLDDETGAELFTDPTRMIRMGRPPYRIEILARIDGVRFDEAWPQGIETTVEGVRVRFISKAHLLRNKRAAGRGKDLIDVEQILKLDR